MEFPSGTLSFDEVEVGQSWKSAGRTVTEADIVHFAGISGDFNSIHINHEFAKKTPFRKPIAHGMLVFSFATGLSLHSPPMKTMAIIQIKELSFLLPVFAGDTVHLESRILEKIPRGRGRRGEVIWLREIVNQIGKVVQRGTIITLVAGSDIKTGDSESNNGNNESSPKECSNATGTEGNGKPEISSKETALTN